MSNTEETFVINKKNISNYTTADRDILLEKSEKNKDGFPVCWPTVNRKNSQVFISFVNAIICNPAGEQIYDEVGNFDILEKDTFDINDSSARTKVKFISALLSNNRWVRGGIYYRGEYYTSKMTLTHASQLTKNFMNQYFHVEDAELLLENFDKMENTDLMPYWPFKSYDSTKKVVFSAVNAYIVKATDDPNTRPEKPFNFNIYEGDTFDLNNKEDLEKAEVIKSLLDANRTVMGFYYKGKLIPAKISKKFKSYFERNFIVKHFTVNQRDYLFTYISKCPNSKYPLYWPTKDDNGREISISVVNASTNLIGDVDDKYSNFDVYNDEFFDLTNEDFKKKLDVIQKLYYKDSILVGGLYFDGALVESIKSHDELMHVKEKVEKALKIYVDDNDEFNYFRNNFTVEDRKRILRLGSRYDDYYPEFDSPGLTMVEKKDEEYNEENPYLVKFDRCNVVNPQGDLVLTQHYSRVINEGETFDGDETLKTLLTAFNSKSSKLKGGVFYKGVNIRKNLKAKLEFANSFLPAFMGDKLSEITPKDEVERFSFYEDKKYKMPKYWPTSNKEGRNVLCSVVDADIHFKVGRKTIKAANNMNFDIYVGETFGLVGESGSGKTTISRAILGINRLTKGGIYYKGRLISSTLTKKEEKATKKNIQMIFQDPAASLNERANVDYIVSEGLYNFKLFKTKEERIEKVTKMLRSVGLLPEHLSRYPHEFSGGQRQRIGIARALVIEPQLVLADEPISALDVSIRAQVLNLLKKLQREQDLTYLFIAHDLSIIRYISDRIAVMHQGYIVELGNAEDIYSHPVHPYTRALLTAIPQPDPKTKDTRKKIVYNKGDLDYSKCEWIQIGEGHYILATQDKLAEWKKAK